MVVESKDGVVASVEGSCDVVVAPAVLAQAMEQEHQRPGLLCHAIRWMLWGLRGKSYELYLFKGRREPCTREDPLVAFVHKEALFCH